MAVSSFRKFLAGILTYTGVSAAVIGGMMLPWASTEHVIGTPSGTLEEGSVSRVWIGSQQVPIAESREGSLLRVWLYSNQSGSFQLPPYNVTLPDGGSVPYAIAEDATVVAYASRGKITVERLAASAPETPLSTSSLKGSGVPRLVFAAKQLIAIYPTGDIQRLSASTLQPEGQEKVSLQNIDLVRSHRQYVLISSAASLTAAVFDMSVSPARLVEFRELPEPLEAFALTDSGRIVAASRRGTLQIPEKIGAPGRIHAVAQYAPARYVVAGDFNGFHLIGHGDESQQLLVTPEGTRSLAMWGRTLVAAGPQGVQLIRLNLVSGLTPSAKLALMIWAGSTLALILWWAVRSILRHWGKNRKAQDRFGSEADLCHLKPPEELLDAISAGECILFTGEALSARAGMPVWHSFIRALLDYLQDLRYVSDDEAEKLSRRHNAGHFEEVAAGVMAAARKRPGLAEEYARTLYLKAAPLSSAHERLGDVPFCGVLSATLDEIVERTFWENHPSLLGRTEFDAALEELGAGSFHIAKLRGRLPLENVAVGPEILILNPKEAFQANSADSGFREYMSTVLRSRTILCLGMSPEEIADLFHLLPNPRTERAHFALLPHARRNPAAAAMARFNIKAIGYPSSNSLAVDEFIEALRTAAPRAVEHAVAVG